MLLRAGLDGAIRSQRGIATPSSLFLARFRGSARRGDGNKERRDKAKPILLICLSFARYGVGVGSYEARQTFSLSRSLCISAADFRRLDYGPSAVF